MVLGVVCQTPHSMMSILSKENLACDRHTTETILVKYEQIGIDAINAANGDVTKIVVAMIDNYASINFLNL